MFDRINKASIADGKDLVCILSARRTGSTLLQNILCQSPQTHAFVSEAQILTRLLDAFQWGDVEFSRMVGSYFGSRENFFAYQKETIASFLVSARKNLNVRKFLVLKNPELALHTEKLVELLPAARFLVLARDPRDQIVSEIAVSQRQIAIKWSEQVPSIRELCALYDRYYASIERGRGRKPAAFLTVRFESLTGQTEATIKTIENFLRIDLSAYNPDAEWKETKVDWEMMKERPSWSEHYGKPITNDPVGSFAEKLDPGQIKEIEECLAGWMRAFDYLPANNHP